jgi:hypothetical protein
MMHIQWAFHSMYLREGAILHEPSFNFADPSNTRCRVNLSFSLLHIYLNTKIWKQPLPNNDTHNLTGKIHEGHLQGSGSMTSISSFIKTGSGTSKIGTDSMVIS